MLHLIQLMKRLAGAMFFHGSKFIQSLDSSIFPHKNDHVNVEDNENDEDSSFSDSELCPIEDIEDDEFASPQEFFPLASQHRTEIVVRKLVIQAYNQLKTNIYL